MSFLLTGLSPVKISRIYGRGEVEDAEEVKKINLRYLLLGVVLFNFFSEFNFLKNFGILEAKWLVDYQLVLLMWAQGKLSSSY